MIDSPARLHGVVLLTSVTGGGATVYDGVDASSGRPVLRVEGTANESRPVMFPEPLQLNSGIFVDVGSNVTEVLVVFEGA